MVPLISCTLLGRPRDKVPIAGYPMRLTSLKGGGGVMDETIAEELKRGFEVDYCLTPRTGMAVIFDHTFLHRGSALTKGVKYIVRTDVVYQRYENPLAEEPYKDDINYKRMVEMYIEAAEWECLGRVDLSSNLYERALSIRQNVARPS